MSDSAVQLAKECRRLEENCLYTSTSLFIWLRFVRIMKVIFVISPILLGALASWSLLKETGGIFPAICAFLAGLAPAIFEALKLNIHIGDVRRAAGEFKNLQDRFRQCALVSALGPAREFEADFKEARKRLENIRAESITVPEWCFRFAQEKVKRGDYSFDVDEAAIRQSSAANPNP